MFEHMVGYDAADNQTQLVQNQTVPGNYTQFLVVGALRGARLGVVRSISDVSFADPEAMALYQGAIDELEEQGGASHVGQSQHTGLACFDHVRVAER